MRGPPAGFAAGASGYAGVMNKALIAMVGLGLAGAGLFGADPRNQAALRLIVQNAASEKPPMQGVVFKAPFVPDPPPKKAYTTLYPQHFTWGTDAVLKYYDLGEGYWQTNGINLNDGQEIKKDEEEWRAHFRFKSNPASDPLHPGHSLLAIDSPQHKVTFAPLGRVDYDSVRTIPANRWLKTTENEQAAVWNLKPGDVIGVKIEAVELNGNPKKRQTFLAKVMLQKLSHDAVRFDYVYRNDGKLEFPKPNRADDE